MSQMTVKVEFLAGTGFKEAAEEAKEKALQWDVAYVCYKFNAANCSIGRNADIEECYEAYRAGTDSIIDA